MTQDRVAVVMGGTSGIGLATARVLVGSGARVVIAGRDAAKGERARSQLGEHARYVQADVADSQAVERVVAEAARTWGRLDWAVNAAALSGLRPAPTAAITEAEWDATIAADLKGVWLSMKYELAVMAPAGAGSIVNISSVNGLSATPSAAAYCAAKHAIHGLSKTAAAEYAACGVRVNVLCPGAHDTPMLRAVFDKMTPGNPERAEAMYRARIPLGRIGDPDESARAAFWLLSDAASYVTGAVLTVDGGMSLGRA